jgi:hypothetical protein
MSHHDNECMICLESIKNISSKMLTCNCRVFIHDECHKKWNEQHNSECPVCRKICSPLKINIPVNRSDENISYNRIHKVKQYITGLMLTIIVVLVIIVAIAM